MPRRIRLTVPNLPHLIMHRGHNGSDILRTPCDRRVFLSALGEAAAHSGCALHAYALLPDRVLVLCTPGSGEGTARLMQDVGRRYAPYFNSTYGRSGALWDGRYRLCVVEPAGPVLSAYRYVDCAAVRDAIPVDPSGRASSSAAAHVGARPWFGDDHPAFVALGNTPAERARVYRGLLEVSLGGRVLAEIEQALSSGLVLGSERFKIELEQRLRRPVRAGRPGRPRKSTAAGRSARAHGGPAQRPEDALPVPASGR